MNDKNKEYEASLKSIETENIIDRIFYRPIGFQIARLLSKTSITPNMVTVLSIIIGACAGSLFYFTHNLNYIICGILLLITANILDCVDGQLARMTGIKSEIGRILDGFAGDVWFVCIYTSFALRLMDDYQTPWFIVVAILSALSHQMQAALTDYYKTLHLYFISKEKGAEFETSEKLRKRYKAMPKGINKFFSWFYVGYTHNQERVTPNLQRMLQRLKEKYPHDIPEDVRLAFRQQSKKLMPLIDCMTFNGRTLVMFIILLTCEVWAYFIFEIIVLNSVLLLTNRKHEKMCASFAA